MKVVFACFLMLLSVQNYAQKTPSLYLIGDSTMADKRDPEENPEHGWGQMLPELMTDNIHIENHAVNGRSSKSFLSEGRWKTVHDKLKSGDFVIIQFGHNDQKFNSPDRYTNPFTGYRYNLGKYVKETREKGAIPILMSSIVRRNFNENGTLVDTHGEYPLVVRMVAKDLDVPFIDMQWLTEQLEVKYGEEESRNLHLHFAPGEVTYYVKRKDDDTHLSEKGATLVATLALQEIAKKDLPLKKYIKKSTLTKEIL
ncbi:rhamnogalacturonan acetylesterase [Zunongwangia endophytica]|uniref:Rhamnogalacturonan acetylesterase n=1 Tax=Zunongwangia endophytica TaxID=1808945 RepID=A0ABV8HBI7_9FLAO|nr:rhamnogalacturonan acetylesterase [Zunongwangia endophytica]MDN3594879.1 rhamnogalacturonan acetylesterase [Zunongwangia endophytica]